MSVLAIVILCGAILQGYLLCSLCASLASSSSSYSATATVTAADSATATATGAAGAASSSASSASSAAPAPAVYSSSRRIDQILLNLGVGSGLGLGLSSCLFFVFLSILHLGFSSTMFIETGTVLLLILMNVLQRKNGAEVIEKQAELLPTNKKLSVGIWIGLGVLTLISISAFVYQCNVRPHGDYDAMMDWTLKAKFLTALNFDLPHSLPVDLFWSHPEYPLLLPIFIAVLWFASPEASQLVPQLVAAVFTAGTALIFWSTLSLIKGRDQAGLGSLFLLSTPFFVLLGSMMIADTPVGFYYTATIAYSLLQALQSKKRWQYFLLAGVSAGLAIWTKREGSLFAATFVLASFLVGIRRPLATVKEVLPFAIGLAPGLGAFLLLKATWAAYTHIMVSFDFAPFLQPTVYYQVFTLYILQLFCFGQWQLSPIPLLILYFFLYRNTEKSPLQQASLVVLLTVLIMNLAYLIIFVNYGQAAAFQVTVDAHRLQMQLWPSMLLLLFANCKTPREILSLGKQKSAST